MVGIMIEVRSEEHSLGKLLIASSPESSIFNIGCASANRCVVGPPKGTAGLMAKPDLG